jgi:hypothetical protein
MSVQERVADDSSEPEQIRMRGFKLQKAAGCLVHVTAGDVVLDASESDLAGTTITYSPKEARSEWVPPMDSFL